MLQIAGQGVCARGFPERIISDSMELSLERIELLLLIAAFVAMIARRLRLPYTTGLVVAGGTLAFLHVAQGVELTKNLIFASFLPPLVFEAALNISWRRLRPEIPVVSALATLGVFISAAVTSVGMHYAVGWEWSAALLFGALIAATDPVSVIAMFKEFNVRSRLRMLLESESLFNDGTASVVFVIVLAAVTVGIPSAGNIAGRFVFIVGGGIACGLLVGGATLLVAGRTTDHLVEITFTTVAAYGSFLIAEHFQASGVLATLTAGLLIGNIGRNGAISERGRVAVESFWEYAAFVVNSLIFILIGMRESQLRFWSYGIPVAVAMGVVLVGRAAAVYPICAAFSRSNVRVSFQHQNLMLWGGLRGALALALALSLPASLPHRHEVITVAFAVVAFSVLVQGLTMPVFLRMAGEIPHRTHREADHD